MCMRDILIVSIFLLVMFCQVETLNGQEDRKRIVQFIPLPDSSHIRDFQMIAKATAALLNASPSTSNTEVQFISPNIIKAEPCKILKHIQCPVPDGFNIAQIMETYGGFANSSVPRLERLALELKMFTAAYDVGMLTMNNLYNETSTCDVSMHRLLKSRNDTDVLLVIDNIFAPVVEWAEKNKMNYVLIGIAPVMFVYRGMPSYLPHLPIGSTSLEKGRRIIEKNGIFAYLANQINEQVIGFGKVVKTSLSVMSEYNKARERYGMPTRSTPFIEPLDKLTIHLTLPGIFEYSFAVPNIHKFVGFNYIEKSMSAKPQFSSMSLEETSGSPSQSEEILWLDEQLRKNRKVVFIAFGTKAKVAPSHLKAVITSILSYPQQSLSVLLASSNIHVSDVMDSHRVAEWTQKILIKDWVAQVNVLKHPATTMFVTHGGSHSIFESITAEVPLLIMPIFGDQPLNAIRSEDHGIARMINPEDKEELSESIAFILENSHQIKQRMRKTKQLNRDVAALPMDAELLKQFLQYEDVHTLSTASVAAAGLIRQVLLYGADHLVSMDTKLSYIEKVHPLYVLILALVSPILIFFIIRGRCSSRGKQGKIT
ncbi:hypothetical protein C9374_012623 [Naegleria lovaniensis]|uniref:UDP-glycosyltransferases domain-containing protein n=1 Tax=Naegleria lovaniensis TaxID=51637 RepID=A0AA88H1I9_NAELO|nr:uncharacterized protein C9374_012623 [Naegleria lovaniensis]KAG2392371.1 hypothetical protein C9374_012623 [Naegleria lovaniensis]